MPFRSPFMAPSKYSVHSASLALSLLRRQRKCVHLENLFQGIQRQLVMHVRRGGLPMLVSLDGHTDKIYKSKRTTQNSTIHQSSSPLTASTTTKASQQTLILEKPWFQRAVRINLASASDKPRFCFFLPLP